MKYVVAAVIALLILAGGAYALVNHNKNNNSASNSSGSSSSSSSSNMNMGSQSNSSGSNTPTATNAVTIQNFAFSPASITVKKGTTVTWTNKDSAAHTVVETDGQTGPSSSMLDTGKSYTFTYNTAGTFKYHCSIHPDMTGTVTVTE